MVRLTRIYTRTGDDGTTGLVGGSRVPKHAPRMEAIGAVDEANAALGLCSTVLEAETLKILRRIQNDLFDLGADLATPGQTEATGSALRIVAQQVEWLEQRIDEINEHLSELRSFVLPGGSEASARLHLARTSVRRAERLMTGLAEVEPVNRAALSYINRLSDLLFVMARAANAGGADDVLWQPGASR